MRKTNRRSHNRVLKSGKVSSVRKHQMNVKGTKKHFFMDKDMRKAWEKQVDNDMKRIRFINQDELYAKIVRDSDSPFKMKKEASFKLHYLRNNYDYDDNKLKKGISIQEVIRKNKEAGEFFFSKTTMSFFNSKIETKGDLINNKYFVTSEKFTSSRLGNKPRKYTVRKFNKKTGSVDTVGEFQQFGSLSSAKKFAEKLK